MEPRHHLKNPVELFTHCFHHRSAFHDENDHDDGDVNNDANTADHCEMKDRKRKSIPAVTLFYDVDKNVTVAVLSQAITLVLAPLAVYFKNRVQQGTAVERSILYYELRGYIRENYSQIIQHQSSCGACFASSIGSSETAAIVAIAVGSLEASDTAQKNMLQEERRLALEQRLQKGNKSSSLSTTSSSTSVLKEEEEQRMLLLLEQAMEIARLHRLNDDLDVLSVYFLRQVNKTCQRIAKRIAQYQLSHGNTTLVISPFVDGVALSGYSNFNRGIVIHESSSSSSSSNNHSHVVMNAAADEEEEEPAIDLQQQQHARRNRLQQSLQLVRHREFGRHIEYRRCQDILLTSTRQNPTIFSPIDDTANLLTWDCEEVAFAVMHRWWGDIAEREYIGQKLVLSWLLRPSSPSSSVASTAGSTKPMTISLPLGTVHLEPHHSSAVKGVDDDSGGGAHHQHHHHHQQHFSISLASRLTLDILHSHTKVIDDVTISYQGKARVCQVQVNFLALVRAAARHCLDSIQQDYRCIQESRPLLDHERAYLRCVQDAACL